MTLHIIHLPERIDRLELLQKELEQESITDYKIWNGIVDPSKTARGISRSHKQIVRFALENGLTEVLIGEDDLHFTAPGAFAYFMSQKPTDYDIYLGGPSHGKLDAANKVNDFAGLLLYVIHHRFYETFLSIPENQHIDRGLRYKGEFIVCNPWPVIEHSGYSDNLKEYCDSSIFYGHRKLFGHGLLGF